MLEVGNDVKTTAEFKKEFPTMSDVHGRILHIADDTCATLETVCPRKLISTRWLELVKNKCSICGAEMKKFGEATACEYSDCSNVRCVCGRKMTHTNVYIDINGKWRFWRCPHCFKRE